MCERDAGSVEVAGCAAFLLDKTRLLEDWCGSCGGLHTRVDVVAARKRRSRMEISAVHRRLLEEDGWATGTREGCEGF